MSGKDSLIPSDSAETIVTHAGRPSSPAHPFVNPPVVRASTVLFESVEDMTGGQARYVYGRRGTPTSEALEEAIATLEGAEGTVIAPSGLAAISVALLACVHAGDHILVADSSYDPARKLCDGLLARMGVEVEYYDPLIGAGIAALFRPNTRLVYMESPGSLSFEMQDVPAIVAAAKPRDILTLIDNTWATPLHFQPLKHGVDISIHSATKYIVGHSDAMLGLASAGPRVWPQLRETYVQMGLFTGPDDMWLALRGLRTLAIRLERHQASALKVARWLEARPEVAQVLYPALPSHPGHAIWSRDFTGASGLFSFVLTKEFASRNTLAPMIDGLRLFGRGYSWGGFESLAIPSSPEKSRTATQWTGEGPLVRLHIGLEGVDDLIADLDAGFARLNGG